MGVSASPSNLDLSVQGGLDHLRALCRSATVARQRGVVRFGFPEVEASLPEQGLGHGLVHEWVGVVDAEPEPALNDKAYKKGYSPRYWQPPFTLLIHLLHSALGSSAGLASMAVWVGEQVWPYLPPLVSPGRFDAVRQSLFVRAVGPAERVWAADLTLRSRAAGVVVVDGTGLDLSATRRLQLACEAGGGVCLLVRPPWERAKLSGAATRWLVSTMPTATPLATQRWGLELLRCKGVQPAPDAVRTWTLTYDHHRRGLRMLTDQPAQGMDTARSLRIA